MKLSQITAPPPIKATKRGHSKSADKGGYCWDNGFAAFGDPMERIGKVAKIRANQRDEFKAQKAARSSRNDFKTKHG